MSTSLETIAELEGIRSSIANVESHNDGMQCLEGLRSFLLQNSQCFDFIQQSKDRDYEEEEMLRGRDYYPYKIPIANAGRIGFTWSLLNYWVNKKEGNYLEVAAHYAGKSTNANDHTKQFHRQVILPFIDLILKHLNGLIPPGTQGPAVVHANNYGDGSIYLQTNSPGASMNVNPGNAVIESLVREISASSYQEREQLISLIRIFAENVESRSKDKGFLALLKSKLDPYIAMGEISQHALQFTQYLGPILGRMLS